MTTEKDEPQKPEKPEPAPADLDSAIKASRIKYAFRVKTDKLPTIVCQNGTGTYTFSKEKDGRWKRVKYTTNRRFKDWYPLSASHAHYKSLISAGMGGAVDRFPAPPEPEPEPEPRVADPDFVLAGSKCFAGLTILVRALANFTDRIVIAQVGSRVVVTADVPYEDKKDLVTSVDEETRSRLYRFCGWAPSNLGDGFFYQ